MQREILSREKTGLLVIDVQDKLFSKVERPDEVLLKLSQIVKGSVILQLPIVVTEQYPKGLGSTVDQLRRVLPSEQQYLPKTTFSCYRESEIKTKLEDLKTRDWILVGIEAHVCVLQTAKDLLGNGKNVVVLNDAISSRSIYDYSSAIAELRDCGARISTTETVLFELLGDAKDPAFKEISRLIQCHCENKPSCCRLESS